MDGPVAQIVALTCYGNAYLAGHDIPAFFPANSTCQYCDKITFAKARPLLSWIVGEREVAATPDDWFQWLRVAGARGIRLSWTPRKLPGIPDRMTAGFVGGGGRWQMETVYSGDRSDSWVARWWVWNQSASDRRIWRVVYSGAPRRRAKARQQADLAELKSRLADSLRAIRAFSAEHGIDPFTQEFDKALDALSSGAAAVTADHKDLAPLGFLADDARALLDASQLAWHFGGMGSWNDMSFNGQPGRRYAAVSESLFQSVNRAIEGAASSSYGNVATR